MPIIDGFSDYNGDMCYVNEGGFATVGGDLLCFWPCFSCFCAGMGFLETLEIVQNMGASNMENQGKMGFWESSWGVVRKTLKILFLVDFWYLVPSLPLLISARSILISGAPCFCLSAVLCLCAAAISLPDPKYCCHLLQFKC